MEISHPATFFLQPTAQDIAQRIKKLRCDRGWSLLRVEEISAGEITAVALGSYERGKRSLSLSRTLQLANLYGVPVGQLLSGCQNHQVAPMGTKLILDLRAISTFIPLDSAGERRHQQLITFINWILNQRSDWNGEILTLRRDDPTALALLNFTSQDSVLAWLKRDHLLFIRRDPS